MTTLYRRLQVTKLHLLANSSDREVRRMFERQQNKVRNEVLKFDPFEELERTETFLLNNERLNEQLRNRFGVGFAGPSHQKAAESAAAMRKQISRRILDLADQERLDHLSTLQMQGRFVEWDGIMQRDFRWQHLFSGAISENVLRFQTNAMMLTLPSEDNKRRWGKASATSICRLVVPADEPQAQPTPCGTSFPTALHVLCGCRAALAQGRFTWRHNSGLLAFKSHAVPQITAINDGKVRFSRPRQMRFRSADTGKWYNNGASLPEPAPRSLTDYLARARDWELRFDLPGDAFSYTQFPPEIASTGLRPDVLLFSRQLRVVYCIELTVPKEERIVESNRSKAAKYEPLKDEAAANGWKLETWPIEVGARGFLGKSAWHLLRALGLGKKRVDRARTDMERTVLRCSYFIFVSRNQPEWEPRPLLPAGRPLAADDDQGS